MLKKNSTYWLYIICFFTFRLTATSDLIRAKIVIKEERDDKYHWQRLLSHEQELHKHGLIIVDKNPDVILCNWVTKELLATNIPIIILEINAAASLKNKTRKHLKYPQVKAVFKNRILRDKNLYNAPHVQQTYFFSQVNNYANLTQPVNYTPLSLQELKKIQLVIWDLDWSQFNHIKFATLATQKTDFTQERPLDLFFAGRLMCNGKSMLQQFYNWHRTKAFEALKKLSNVQCKIVEGRTLSFDTYIKTITTAKIVVSPWGWGEWCYRDFETLLRGAVLIKPDSSFVLSYPDIYINNTTYVPCKPDFSDLEQKVTMILNDYDHYIKLTRAAHTLITESWKQYDQLFSRFVQSIALNLKES